jgi:hypothetical protein
VAIRSGEVAVVEEEEGVELVSQSDRSNRRGDTQSTHPNPITFDCASKRNTIQRSVNEPREGRMPYLSEFYIYYKIEPRRSNLTESVAEQASSSLWQF